MVYLYLSSTISPLSSRVKVDYSISSIQLVTGGFFFTILDSAPSGTAACDFLFSLSLGRSAHVGISARCAARVSKNDLNLCTASHLPMMPPCIQTSTKYIHIVSCSREFSAVRSRCNLVLVPFARVLLRTQLQAPYALEGIFLLTYKVNLGEG
jgi:hypothetical protein